MAATHEERLLAAFIESSLQLVDANEEWLEKELQKLPPERRDKIARIRASLKENPLTEEELRFFKR